MKTIGTIRFGCGFRVPGWNKHYLILKEIGKYVPPDYIYTDPVTGERVPIGKWLYKLICLGRKNELDEYRRNSLIKILGENIFENDAQCIANASFRLQELWKEKLQLLQNYSDYLGDTKVGTRVTLSNGKECDIHQWKLQQTHDGRAGKLSREKILEWNRVMGIRDERLKIKNVNL